MSAITYPTMPRRYMASLIDGLLIVSSFLAVTYLVPMNNEAGRLTRLGIIFGAFFVYEPFFTSRLCTLGQKITGIRIRNISNLDKISFFAALRRSLVKLVLGIVSLVTMHFNEKRRAIHDFSAGSIVVYDDPTFASTSDSFTAMGNSISAR